MQYLSLLFKVDVMLGQGITIIKRNSRAQELCENGGGRPGLLSVPNSPYHGPVYSSMVPTVSVDVKQH